MRVLLINYDFPPALSGVRRIVKFAKYLPEFGIEPVVLCARPARGEPLDFEALRDVEAQGYQVVRTGSIDPQHVAGWIPRIGRGRKKAGVAGVLAASDHADDGDFAEADAFAPTDEYDLDNIWEAAEGIGILTPSKVRGRKSRGGLSRALGSFSRRALIPDDRRGWVPFAIRAAKKLLREQHFDAILTSSYPNSAHLVGLRLKRKFGIRWIADFRDGWTQNPYFAQSLTPLHRAINRRMEAQVVRAADVVTTVSRPIAEHLQTLDAEHWQKVHVLPNGFDPDDYDAVEPLWFRKFTLAYTGTLFLQRSPDAFFWAVRGLLDEFPAMRPQFQIIFRTKFQPEHEATIRDLGLEDVIQNWGLGTHREALQLQAAAHALLILENDAPNAEIMLTQKVFEYLSAGKPILAVAPTHGALANLIRRTGAGVVVPPEEIFSIKERLWELFNDQFWFEPDERVIRSFTRREQAREMAQLIRGRIQSEISAS